MRYMISPVCLNEVLYGPGLHLLYLCLKDSGICVFNKEPRAFLCQGFQDQVFEKQLLVPETWE